MKIHESYCSYGVTKLLVNHGFNSNLVRGIAVSHYLALSWLRNRGYSIDVFTVNDNFIWNINKLDGTFLANSNNSFQDHEKCIEAALKYYLKNFFK